MIIGIDGNEANIKNRVGVNQYAYDMLWALHRLTSEAGKISLISKACKPHRLIVYLKNRPLKELPKPTKNLQYKILPSGPLWIATRLTPYLLFGFQKPDVLFAPSHYLPPISTVSQVCVIHDLAYLENSGQFSKPTFWQLKYWTARSVSISKSIIAVSNSTKEEIVRHYPKAKNKISVIYHGYDKNRFNTQISPQKIKSIQNKYLIVGEYILYLGTLKPSKNIEQLVESFAKISKDRPNLSLVIAGKKGWLYDEIFKKVKKLKLDNKIIFTDFLPEEDKPALMAGAKVLATPSLTEGFGMIAIESMACGTPVVVSEIPAFGEVVADAGIFVDPNSTSSIAEGIDKILNMPKVSYNKLVSKGLKRASEFSWEKAARQTLEVLENAAK